MSPQPCPAVDLSFAAFSTQTLPADHGYALLGALSRLIPLLHEASGIAVHPIVGRIVVHRRLRLCRWSDVRLRVSPDQIPMCITLAGQQLDVDGTLVRLGVPQVLPLQPSRDIACRLAVIKGYMDPPEFAGAVRRQLDKIGVSRAVGFHVQQRRTLRIKDKQIVGFGLHLLGLAPNESLDLQIGGIGGRRHMGCGVFRPISL